MAQTAISGVLLDLAGVVYQGDAALPGAVDAIGRLRATGLPVRFVTNTTSKPKRIVVDSLQGMGFEIASADVFTPAQAAREWLTQRGLAAHLLIAPGLVEDFDGVPRADGCGEGTAVVVGDAGEGFTYAALNAAYRVLADGAALLALADNRSFRSSDGRLSLDTGPFVRALSYGANVDPVVLGKPAPAFFHAALDAMACGPDAAVMVGDDVEADVAGALDSGLGAALLVRTGKYTNGAETGVTPAPTAIVDDLTAAADWIVDRAS